MKFLKLWFPVVLYCCIIFGVSSIQNVDLGAEVPNFDKVVHVVEYGILGILFARAVRNTSLKASLPLVFAITLYFVVFYGIIDEFHQSFVVGRSSDLSDLMADTVGGALASLGYLVRKKHNSNV